MLWPQALHLMHLQPGIKVTLSTYAISCVNSVDCPHVIMVHPVVIRLMNLLLLNQIVSDQCPVLSMCA